MAWGKNAAGDELIFGGVGTAGDDACGVGVTNALEGLELVSGSGVDVEWRSSGRSCRSGNGFGLGYGKDWYKGEEESGGEKLIAKVAHRWCLRGDVGDLSCERVREATKLVKQATRRERV